MVRTVGPGGPEMSGSDAAVGFGVLIALTGLCGLDWLLFGWYGVCASLIVFGLLLVLAGLSQAPAVRDSIPTKASASAELPQPGTQLPIVDRPPQQKTALLSPGLLPPGGTYYRDVIGD